MSRIARKYLGTPFLHVMVQGVNKEYIFYKKTYIEKYLNLFYEIKKDYDFILMAFCVMSNHAHFLIYTEDINSFGKFMQKLNLKYSNMYNKLENRCGVLFRNRYKTEPIYNKKYLINCIKYIHNNPVNAGIAKICGEYKYSSYNDYMNNTGISQNKIIEEILGKDCDYKSLFKQENDRLFMEIEEDEEKDIGKYVELGIKEFIQTREIRAKDIFENRLILKELISFLNEECNIRYVDIGNALDISKNSMNTLKRK